METNQAVLASPALRPSAKTLNGDFRLYLERELAKRCQQNPKYSLRAFAKFLGLEHSRLSKILRAERPVSNKLIAQLGQRLNLGQQDIFIYMGFAGDRKPLPLAPDQRYLPLALDLFECLEDWRHYALLELMKLPEFQTSEKWLAGRLNTSAPEIRACVERLKRTGMIRVKADGGWTDTSEGFSTHILSDTETTYAHRRSQKKILELAARAVDDIPMPRRDQSSMMMATSAAKIAEAKIRIAKFRRELCAFLEDTDEKDAVYQLSVSLFPLVEAEAPITLTNLKSKKSENRRTL